MIESKSVIIDDLVINKILKYCQQGKRKPKWVCINSGKFRMTIPILGVRSFEKLFWKIQIRRAKSVWISNYHACWNQTYPLKAFILQIITKERSDLMIKKRTLKFPHRTLLSRYSVKYSFDNDFFFNRNGCWIEEHKILEEDNYKKKTKRRTKSDSLIYNF